MLSWYIVVVGTGCPCEAKKCLVHSTWPIALSTATNSASIELLVFCFCLHEAVYVTPFQVSCIFLCDFSCLGVLHTSCPPTILLHCPVQLLVSCFLYFLCIASLLLISCSRQYLVPLPWCIERLLLFCMSCLVRLLRYSNFATS